MRPTHQLLAATCLAAFMLPQASHAGPAQRLLKIDVRVEGEESWKDGGSSEKGTISERFYFATILQASPDLNSMNLLDPESVKKTQAKSAQVQARVAQVQQRQKALGSAGMPSAAAQEQMNAAIMQAYQRCKGDESCIREAVMKAQPQLMAPAQGISVAPNSSMNTGGDEPDEKEIYQNWLSFDGCVGKTVAFRNDVSDGSISDVGGARPRHREIKINAGGVKSGLCNAYTMTIVDTETKKLYLESFAFPGVETKSVTTGSSVGNVPIPQGTSTVPADVQAWLNKNVRGIPLSGSKTETITLRTPIIVSPWKNYSGKARITMTWSFVDSWTGPAEKLPEN
ncbi:hypothetical protein [Microvirga alba]|uniref:Uncharacterized protein n=1 Tax=Microvirga alba TaxID=2791025 RepID=A0A931FRK9_9HYPH|nr:hypothetical protein [Microvirga alba]MBF9232851.1 hypothetical protein [Microvirga alba]